MLLLLFTFNILHPIRVKEICYLRFISSFLKEEDFTTRWWRHQEYIMKGNIVISIAKKRCSKTFNVIQQKAKLFINISILLSCILFSLLIEQDKCIFLPFLVTCLGMHAIPLNSSILLLALNQVGKLIIGLLCKKFNDSWCELSVKRYKRRVVPNPKCTHKAQNKWPFSLECLLHVQHDQGSKPHWKYCHILLTPKPKNLLSNWNWKRKMKSKSPVNIFRSNFNAPKFSTLRVWHKIISSRLPKKGIILTHRVQSLGHTEYSAHISMICDILDSIWTCRDNKSLFSRSKEASKDQTKIQF